MLGARLALPTSLLASLILVAVPASVATGKPAKATEPKAKRRSHAKRPHAPRRVSVTQRTTRSIRLDWADYRRRRYFKVYVYAADGRTLLRTVRTDRGRQRNASAWTVRNLRPQTRYAFRVAAVFAQRSKRRLKETPKSSRVEAATASDRAAPAAAPAPPAPSRFPGHFFIASDSSTTWNPQVDAPRIDYLLAHSYQDTATAATYKQYNPNGVALFYDDFGVAGDPCCAATVLTAMEVDANNWWATRDGGRIANPWGGPTALVDLGKPGVKEAYVRALVDKKAASPHWAGVFADDVNAWRNAWPIDGYSSPEDWVKRAVNPLIAYVRDNFPGLVVPNMGNWPQEPVLDSTAGLTTGGLTEWFGMWNGSAQAPPEIENTFRSVRDVVSNGRMFFGVSHSSTLTKYTFCLAAILGEPGRILVTNQTDYGTPGAWDPVFETDLGAPTGAAAHASGSPTWSRSFANGYTLTVDTTELTCSGI
jgi:hypothetical protein